MQKSRHIVVRALSLVIALVGLCLVVGGAELVLLGGSWYYALSGLICLLCAVLLWRRDRRGAWVYGAFLVATFFWALWESGLNYWALAPRLIGPAIVGLVLLSPWVQRSFLRPAPAAMGRIIVALSAVCICILAFPFFTQARRNNEPLAVASERNARVDDAGARDWPFYGRDQAGTRFSPLTQINGENISKLELAWIFRTGALPKNLTATLQATPLKIDDTLYLCNGVNKVFALDPETGEQRWSYDPHTDTRGLLVATCRGVAYYRNPNAKTDAACADRIITSGLDGRLIALDAKTGALCKEFGDHGAVDLKKGLSPHIRGYYAITSAPTIVRGKIIVGGWVTDNQHIGEPSGVVRAFDAVTGKFVWAWDIGRPNDTSEPKDGKYFTPGTPNVWAPPSADEALGLVYLPTGNATPDFWGGARTKEMDKYSSSVVALEVETGRVRWAFQTTHHDIWDYDVPAQPTLTDFPVEGKLVPAVIQPTKRAETFVLDRTTGAPLVKTIELPVPQGAAPGDRTSSTQPFPVGMPSMAGPRLTEKMAWGLTPIDQLICRISFRKARYEGAFTPLGIKPIIQYPGYSGGSSWGGVAVDSQRQLMVINVNRFAQYGKLISRSEADRAGLKPYTGVVKDGVKGEAALGAPQIGTPYAAIMGPWVSPLSVPCQQPPFGTIAVVDLATRKVRWIAPFGAARDSGPFGIASGLPSTLGTPNLGGAIVTGSGLIFIGATQERAFRGLDLNSGKELWKVRVPAGANATPMTYISNKTGRQFVVIAAGGNPHLGGPSGDYIIAYALPKKQSLREVNATRNNKRSRSTQSVSNDAGLPPRRNIIDCFCRYMRGQDRRNAARQRSAFSVSR